MSERPTRFGRLLRWAVYLLPFACLTTGAWMLSPPAGLIVLGALVWIDLQLASAPRRPKR